MEINIRDAAKLFSVDEKTLYQWIKTRGLPCSRIRSECRFNTEDLLEWASVRRVPFRPEQLHPGAGPENGDTPPSLCDCLERGGVCYEVPGETKVEVITAVVTGMRFPEAVDRDGLLQMLLAREALGTTAVGDGIAIPHVRNPVILRLAEPSVTLCFLRQAIAFGAVDGRPVHTLFTLISPSIRIHLHLLSRLSHVLRDPGFSQALKDRATAGELFRLIRHLEPTRGEGGERPEG